jgi:hypothetical protein
MKGLRNLSAVLGMGCLVLGLLGVLIAIPRSGETDELIALCHTLVTSGAIIIAGVLISSAIADSRKE